MDGDPISERWRETALVTAAGIAVVVSINLGTDLGHYRSQPYDPACFVYPEANACRPGDRFPIERSADAVAFASYRPYPFHVPGGQKAAEVLNLVGLVVVVGFLGFAAAWRRRR